jgi:hypothetical protein
MWQGEVLGWFLTNYSHESLRTEKALYSMSSLIRLFGMKPVCRDAECLRGRLAVAFETAPSISWQVYARSRSGQL